MKIQNNENLKIYQFDFLDFSNLFFRNKIHIFPVDSLTQFFHLKLSEHEMSGKMKSRSNENMCFTSFLNEIGTVQLKFEIQLDQTFIHNVDFHLCFVLQSCLANPGMYA